jgi:fatty acid desaturase
MSDTPSYTIKIPARRVEWPTVILTIAIYGGFLALTFWWQSLPVVIVALAGGWLIGWQGSLQHEVIHGHPTGNQRSGCPMRSTAKAILSITATSI